MPEWYLKHYAENAEQIYAGRINRKKENTMKVTVSEAPKPTTSTKFFQGKVTGELYYQSSGGRLTSLETGTDHGVFHSLSIKPLEVGTKIEITV